MSTSGSGIRGRSGTTLTPEAELQSSSTGQSTVVGKNTGGIQRAGTTTTQSTGTTAQTGEPISVVSTNNGVLTASNGQQFDMTTAVGIAEAKAALGANYQAAIDTLEKQGFRLDGTTGTFVANDGLDSAKAANKFIPFNAASLSTSDQEIVNAMAQRGFPNLVNPSTAQHTYAALTSSANAQTFSAAVAAAKQAIANPTSGNSQSVTDYINSLAINTGQNVMEILFFVFRQSIQATNDDKKYFLDRLQDYNLMAEKLSDYLSQLVTDSQNLSQASAGAKYPEKVTIPITVDKFDLTTLDKNGEVAHIAGYPQTKIVDRSGLNDTIKDVETSQETVRNKRQMASTAFENFDQKANQLYNLMATVLKTTNEMRSSTTRNML
jgi:hypothetical protein